MEKEVHKKTKKNEKGFSSVLLFNLSPFGDNFKELNEGIIQGETNNNNSFENDFLSSDLLHKIDSESPNQVHKIHTASPKITKVNIENIVHDISSNNYSSEDNRDSNDNDEDIILTNNSPNPNQTNINKSIFNKPTIETENVLILKQLEQQKKNISNYTQEIDNDSILHLYSNYDANNTYIPNSIMDNKDKTGKNADIYTNYEMKGKSQQREDELYSGNINNNSNNQILMQFQSKSQNAYFPVKHNDFNKQDNNNPYSYLQNLPIPAFIPTNINTNNNIQPEINESKITKRPKKGKEDDYIIEMFGRIGWICDQCNNFNYDTRTKCNRCGIPKSPKKITKLKRKLENKKKELLKQQQQQQLIQSNNNDTKQVINIQMINQLQQPKIKNEEQVKTNVTHKKQLNQRIGDWVCVQCKNLNFSFRLVCNRCQLTKQESDMIILDYMNSQQFPFSNNNTNNNEMDYYLQN